MARYKEAEVQKQPEKNYIKNVVELYHEYDKLVDKAQMHTDAAYTTIIPIDEKIFSNKKTGALGKLDNLRFNINQTQLKNTTTGKEVLQLLDDFETLDQWRGRYTLQLEEFFKDMIFLLQSSFEIIEKLQKDINSFNQLHTNDYREYNPEPYQQPRFEKPVYVQPEQKFNAPIQQQLPSEPMEEMKSDDEILDDTDTPITEPPQPQPIVQRQEHMNVIIEKDNLQQMRNEIIRLYKEGKTQTQIAQILGFSQSKVSRLLLSKE